jgi:para-aminobenzoate synthetase
MRTLLVDNFDSYTYNLSQLIAQVQGNEPIVMRNNDPAGAELDLNGFDNIVISPGPGHPANTRDFGFSKRVLAEAQVPVLGVCLGHQGLGLEEAAEVGPAPTARHGHLATIRHDGRDLFDWVPQGFTAVRYHSLCIRGPLPPALEATAWSEDGVLMGVRHRSRPLWGLQFHPESILTEHGRRLIANFRDLTRRRAAQRLVTVAGSYARTADTLPMPVLTAAGPAPKPPIEPPHRPLHDYRLHKRVLDFAVDPELAFSQFFATAPRAFWLDSSRVEPGQARFSYFGDGTGPLAEFVRYDVEAGAVEVERYGRPAERVAGSAFDYLKAELARRRVDDGDLPFDFTCGYVGYLGYEMKADCGAVNTKQARTPDACWLFADRMVVVDHQAGQTYLLALTRPTGDPVTAGADAAEDWLDRTATHLRTLAPGPAETEAEGVSEQASPGASGILAIGSDTSVEPWLVRDRAQYLADIATCKSKLLQGESYEICLTDAAWLPAPGDPLDYHRLLRRHNPAPYAAFLRFDDVAVASSSPERFLKIDRDGTVEAKPIKGTAPRDEDPEADARWRRSLTTSKKTRAENLMIVDLLRNDLGQVCEVGTVRVPKLMATESYATVHQLVSTVTGSLRAGIELVDCVRACFPAGSMTGAPKLRTLEIIDALETDARGVYSGAIGFLSCNGTADLSVVIRTAVFVDGRMQLGGGGAIVLGSDPEEEYAEMLLKMAAPMRAYWDWVWAETLSDRPESEPQDGFGATLPRQLPTVRTTAGPPLDQHSGSGRTRTLARPHEEAS